MYERVGPGTEIKGEPHHPTPGTHISEFASEELGAPWHVFACNRRYRMLELASPREGNKPPHSLGGTGVVIGASRNVTSLKRQRNGGTMRRPACLPGAGSTIPAVGQIGYLPPIRSVRQANQLHVDNDGIDDSFASAEFTLLTTRPRQIPVRNESPLPQADSDRSILDPACCFSAASLDALAQDWPTTVSSPLRMTDFRGHVAPDALVTGAVPRQASHAQYSIAEQLLSSMAGRL